MAYIRRILEDSLEENIAARPLVYLNGMRQCGKSTLAQNMPLGKELNYITFDNPASLFFAKNDPAAFIESLSQDKLNVLDEIQLAPELYRFFKMSIDEKRAKGNDRALYLLTGSANLFALPKLADALVGRMSILTLYPFSASEVNGTGINFLKNIWDAALQPKKYPRADIVDVITSATFPEIALDKKKNRQAWFNDYITTILQRDVRTLADIRNPDNIYHLLISLALRAGSLLTNANVMKEIGLDFKTYEKYKALCESVFLTFELQSWTKPNKLNKQFVKQKKLYFTDTNMLCHMMQRDLKEIYKNEKTTMGHVFENFVATEIMKAAKSLGSFSVSHFNPVQNHGKEVDFVIENTNGEAVGIDVKLDGTVGEKDWANMSVLEETLGNKFNKGIIIYTGTDMLQVGRNIWAVPVNYLWER